MCDAMFVYALERADSMGNLPTIPEWEPAASAYEMSVEEAVAILESEAKRELADIRRRAA